MDISDDGAWTTDSDTSMRYGDDTNLDDLDNKIALLKEQLVAEAPQSIEPGKLQYELGERYTERYEKSNQPEDIEVALSYYNAAVDLAPGEPTYLLALGLGHSTRFQITGDIDNVKAALRFMLATVNATPVEDVDLPARQQAIAATYRTFFQKTGEAEAIQSAITWDQKAINAIPSGHTDASDHYQSLALSYMVKYERFGDIADLNYSLQYNETAVSKIADNHPQPGVYYDSLAEAYRERFRRLGNMSDIDSALHHNYIAVQASAKDTDLAEFLKNLAVSHRDRFQATGDPKDLIAALENDHAALATTDEGDPKLPYYWQSLATSYLEKFKAFNDLDVLHSALEYNKKALAEVPEEDEDYPEFQAQLGVTYLHLFEAFEEVNYLTLAIECFSEAKRTTPVLYLNLPNILLHLGTCYYLMFQLLGRISDLDLCLEYNKLAYDGTPLGHPEHPHVLKNLAIAFQGKYQTTGDVNDLQSSFNYTHSALEAISPKSPEIPGIQLDLARSHTLKFQRFGEKKDLDCALELLKTALKELSPEHTEYPSTLVALAETYEELFTITGELETLEISISNYYTALKAAKTPPAVASCERGLSTALYYRFIRLNDLNDLQNALEYATSAIAASQDESPTLSNQQYSLALIYNQHYDRFGDLEDLEAAIKYGQAAVKGSAPGNPGLQTFQRGLATSYTTRFLKYNNQDDLNMALHYDQAATEGTPQNHYNYSLHLQSLGVSYSNKFLVSKDIKDLKNALNYKHAAMASAQSSPSNFAAFQSSLAYSYLDQFYEEEDPEDLYCALYYLRNSATVLPTSKPLEQWDAACRWATVTFHHELPECIEAFSVVFQFLPDLLWIGSPVSSRHSLLLHFDLPTVTMWAVSACIRFNMIALGVELLEQGLAITHQQQLQLKDAFTLLLKTYPTVAEELKEISHQIQKSAISEEKESLSIHTLVLKRQNQIKHIRTLPGFEEFLLPTPFKRLASAAKNGPVVLLTCTTVRADAILLLPPNGEYFHVALPSVTKAEVETQLKLMRDALGKIGIYARNHQGIPAENPAVSKEDTSEAADALKLVFDSITTWLWENVVSLVFKALQSVSTYFFTTKIIVLITMNFTQKNIVKGRIWWCATGPFTYLPLHAAPPLPEDVFDHSYTPTLAALVKANEKYATQVLARNNTTLTFIGVPEIPGKDTRKLPSVPLELDQISSAVGAEQVHSIVGEAATVTAVSSALASSKWLHLACHGEQDAVEPLQSHLVLYDGGLKLENIFDTYIPDAQFVFLSACETAMGDTGLINESMHLTGGMIFAGFCGAIGTMWSIADQDGPPLAGIVYKRAFGKDAEKVPDVRGVSRALHMSIRAMRRSGLPFQRWAPFVHVGI